MICEKCGHEYYGFECPNCAFHKDPAQQEENHSESTEPVNAEPVNAEPVNAEPVNAEPVNTEPVNAEPANAEPEATEKPAEPQEASDFGWKNGSELKASFGVHSDTVHAPEGFQASQNPQQEGGPKTPQICPFCGAVVTDGAQFCGQCGTPINPVNGGGSWNAQNQYSANRFTDNYLRERNNDTTGLYHRKMKPGMVILIVALILLVEIVPLILELVVIFKSDEFASGFEAGMNDAFTQLDPDYYEEDPEWYDDPDFYSEDLLPEDDTAGSEAVDEGESIYPNGVSIAEYNQLEVGMTYGEISFIIGGDAQKQDLESAQEGEIIALWPGEYEVSAVIRITFVDGVATKIEQNGLF